MASTTLDLNGQALQVKSPIVVGDSIYRGRFYRPELDILRFFAFLVVFMHHAMYNFIPMLSRCGAYGLSLFFFLSAFLITELLQREKDQTGSLLICNFYIRRALRIWPLYFMFLAFTLVLAHLIREYQAPTGMLLSFVFLMGNFYIGRNGFPNNPAAYLWSISVEEQFYLFWPFLNQKCSKTVLSWIALASLLIGSLMTLQLWHLGASTTIGIWTNSLVEFQFFGYGILLSMFLNGRVPSLSFIVRGFLFVAGIISWLVASLWSGINLAGKQGPFGPMIGYHLVGLGCTGIFLSLYGIQGKHLPKALVYLGKISYGLYVFHELCLEIAQRIVVHLQTWLGNDSHLIYGSAHVIFGLIFTVGLACFFYKYFETPFLKLKEKFTVVRSRTI